MLKIAFGFVLWMFVLGFLLWLLGLVGVFIAPYAANPWGFLVVITIIFLFLTNLISYISQN